MTGLLALGLVLEKGTVVERENNGSRMITFEFVGEGGPTFPEEELGAA